MRRRPGGPATSGIGFRLPSCSHDSEDDFLATTLIRATGSAAAPAALIAACAALSLAGSLGVGRYGGNVLGRNNAARQ